MDDPDNGAYGVVWWNQAHPGPFANIAALDYGAPPSTQPPRRMLG